MRERELAGGRACMCLAGWLAGWLTGWCFVFTSDCKFHVYTAPKNRDAFEMAEATDRPTDRSTNPHKLTTVAIILVSWS